MTGPAREIMKTVRLGMGDSPLGELGHSGGERRGISWGGSMAVKSGSREDGECQEGTDHQVQRIS